MQHPFGLGIALLLAIEVTHVNTGGVSPFAVTVSGVPVTVSGVVVTYTH